MTHTSRIKSYGIKLFPNCLEYCGTNFNEEFNTATTRSTGIEQNRPSVFGSTGEWGRQTDNRDSGGTFA